MNKQDEVDPWALLEIPQSLSCCYVDFSVIWLAMSARVLPRDGGQSFPVRDPTGGHPDLEVTVTENPDWTIRRALAIKREGLRFLECLSTVRQHYRYKFRSLHKTYKPSLTIEERNPIKSTPSIHQRKKRPLTMSGRLKRLVAVDSPLPLLLSPS